MILQSGINFRSFAEQKSFSFDLDISLSSSSGISNLGFSGNSNYYNFFKFENGRIFDPLNRFVYNYSKDELINISGNFSSGVFGYYINNNLIAVNLPISDSSKSFDHFLLSTQSAAANFNVDINAGNVPSYYISFNNANLLTGQNILGSIVNNSEYNWQSFKVFSGNCSFNYTGYQFLSTSNNLKISGGNSGDFLFNYSGDGTDYSISPESGVNPLTYNINLYTNFGLINKTGLIDLGHAPSYFINFYNYQSGIVGSSNYYWDYFLESKVCESIPFKFTLEKVSGFNYKNTVQSGLDVTGIISGPTSGVITGSGFLNGILTGTLYSDTYDFYNNRLITGFQAYNTGIYDYATGFIGGTGYRKLEYISGSIFGYGGVDLKYNDVLKSRLVDYRDGQYLYSSGNVYSKQLTGIVSTKQTGEYYEYYIPGFAYLRDMSTSYPVTGNFTGVNVSELVYSGVVIGSGSISSPANYSLNYNGIFTGLLTGDREVTARFTSGVNYINNPLLTGVSASGFSSILNYSNYIFSGAPAFYKNKNTNESISGNLILDGLTGSLSFIANTQSGTSGINIVLTGSSLPANTGNLSGYYPSFLRYPESFVNTWERGYSIYSDLSGDNSFNNNFRNTLGDPLNFAQREWYGFPYLNTNTTLNNSYIQIVFNDGVTGNDIVCDSYCIAPHPEYPSPSSWSISGSNNGTSWILLDNKSGQNLEKNYLKLYNFNNSTFYKYLHFKIMDTDSPNYHIPRVSNSEILNNNYRRGIAKFNFLKKIPVEYLSKIEKSIPFIDYYSALKNNISVSDVSTDEFNYGKHRAFDNDLQSETWIYNKNSTVNNTNNRGVIINKNLSNTGVISLDDISQASEITEAGFNDNYNFYGGQFNTFMGQARSNFAVTNKNNTLSNSGVYAFANKVQLIEVTGSRLVVSSQNETRFLTGLSLSALNSNLYTSSLFTAAEPYSSGWRMGGTFSAQHNVDRTTLFTTGLQNTNGRDYILNNGLIYTNISGDYITGFPLVRNWSGFSQPNWEMGVDSDGYSQLRYNLHNENNSTQLPVGVSGIISHDLFVPQLNQTKKITYIYGDFSTSKFFKGRGSTDNGSNQLANPQGRNIYCQRMATGRDSILNYEFPNSGITAGIESMQIDSFGGNLICMGSFNNIGNIPNNLKRKMVFYSLPNESRQIPIAQDLRNEYNGFTGIGQTGFVSGGFVMKRNPEFYADNTIFTSLLSGSSGLFIGGNFSNPRIPASAPTPFSNGRAILINISGNNGSGIIVTGYNVNGTVRAMDLDNQGNIHLGGEFTSASSSTRNRYARYNALTAALQPLDLNFNDTVYGLLCDRANNTLWVAGDFTTINGGTITRNRAARINLTNNQVEAWNIGNGFNGRVKGIITGFNSDLIFYGSFSQFSGISCRGVAKFTSAGSFITGGASLRRASDNNLWDNLGTPGDCAIDPVDKSIYLTYIGDQPSRGDYVDGTEFNYNYRRIIRYNYDTLNPSGVAPNFIYGYPRSIKYWNDRLIIGGDNFSVGYGQFTEGIAAFINEPTGQILTTFNPQLNGTVRSACKVNDGLILAGGFNSCNGVFRSGLAKVDFYGNIITGFNPTCQNPDIIEIKNTPSGVFALTSKSWNPSTPGHFYKIDPSNGSLLENYSFNISESTYSNGDFFIDNSPSSTGHVVISNVKNYNPSAFIEYTFPDPINAVQGYNIKFSSGLNPDSYSFMASGAAGGLYQVIESKNSPISSGIDYWNYNINYPLSGIKKVKFEFVSKNTIGIRNIGVYTRLSGSSGDLKSLSLGHVRASGVVQYTGVPELLYTGNNYVYQYADSLEIDSLYKQTGYIETGDFQKLNNYGAYRASKTFGSVLVTQDSGINIIKNIKQNEITGYRQSEIILELKSGFENYLTNGDKFKLNYGELNGFTQNVLEFYYADEYNYYPWYDDQFDSIDTFVSKLNGIFYDHFTGSYDSVTRKLKINSVGSIGHSGNMVYFQPIIASGLNNFLKNNNYSTSDFYFSGGQTYFKDIDTGVYTFNSGVFSLGSLNPPAYFHKTEYKNLYETGYMNPVLYYNEPAFFTGALGLNLVPSNPYSVPFYATGLVNYNYNVKLTGIASGWDPITNSSGIVTGIINKTGSLSQYVESGEAKWNNVYLTDTGSAGNVYVIPSGGIDFTEVSNYWYGDFVGLFNFTSLKTGYYYNNAQSNVLLNTGFNWVDYDSDFKYNLNIKSGNDFNEYSGININYNNPANLYEGSGSLTASDCVALVESQSKRIRFEIDYYNPYNSGNNIMKYTISGLTGSYLFTGLINE
jgi:hypothetical protein